ncbi:MAG: hypothetical protein ABIX01_07660 [Chitinophagaceae bacterium]
MGSFYAAGVFFVPDGLKAAAILFALNLTANGVVKGGMGVGTTNPGTMPVAVTFVDTGIVVFFNRCSPDWGMLDLKGPKIS